MQSRNRILLVGQQQVDPKSGDHSLIASMFERLPKQVTHAGRVSRFVGYERPGIEGDHLRFFGIEVDAIDDLPDGTIAWELSDTEWTIWESRNAGKAIVWQERIAWEWLDRSASGTGRRTGEFVARGPVNAGSEARPFWMFSNSYVDRERSEFRDDIYLVDHDPSWPAQYEQMADWLRSRLGTDVVLRVEHYGSTAIPGMPAKPVIDILVEVPSFAEAKRRVIPYLNEETWEYWWYAGHMVFFKRKELMGERTHHVHLAPRGHAFWDGLVFRDYLRSHPADAVAYAALKRRLADRYRRDREAYTDSKGEFVRDVLSRAKRGWLKQANRGRR